MPRLAAPSPRRALTLTVLVSLVAGVAFAHSFLERAEPRPGSTVKAAPTEVRLRFTERLEPAFSTVQVTDEKGRRVDRGEAHTEPGSPRQLRVPLEPLGAGRYAVRWRVLSVDSHVVEGDFSFRVAP
ncbi:MAG TPA: copper resistance CopC family protein [Methylomirabilota bacterium]|nr:copper resistance CopC family protein [Methylomirabilota bacterium]